MRTSTRSGRAAVFGTYPDVSIAQAGLPSQFPARMPLQVKVLKRLA